LRLSEFARASLRVASGEIAKDAKNMKACGKRWTMLGQSGHKETARRCTPNVIGGEICGESLRNCVFVRLFRSDSGRYRQSRTSILTRK
jgi:hypothetical protein